MARLVRLTLTSFWMLTFAACATSTSTTTTSAETRGRPLESGGRDMPSQLMGQVLDMDGAPLQKVTISTLPPSTTTLTDTKGQFSLGVPEGKVTLVITDSSGEVTEQEVIVEGTEMSIGEIRIDSFGDDAATPVEDGEGRPLESGGRDSN